MSDYIPYEERLRQKAEQEQAEAVANARNLQTKIQTVNQLIQKLIAAGNTEIYVEVLAGAKKAPRDKQLLMQAPKRGPVTYIDEVLPGWHIRNGIQEYDNEGFDRRYAIQLVASGRFWRHDGYDDYNDSPERGIYQHWAKDAERVEDLGDHSLDLIIEHLSTL